MALARLGSVAAHGRIGGLIGHVRLLLRIRSRSVIYAQVFQVTLLLGRLAMAVRGALRLVDVLVDAILRNGTLSCITHAPMHRTSRASSSIHDDSTSAIPAPQRVERGRHRLQVDAFGHQQIQR